MLSRQNFNIWGIHKINASLVVSIVRIPHLQENNVRQGFFAEGKYKVFRGLPPDIVKVPLIIAYWTGIRTGEVLWLQRGQLDLERGLLRLEPGTTKNNRGRLVPLVKKMIEALWQWK